MGRAPCCDKNGLKKGPWTTEEDQKLIDYIQKHGYGNWRTLPKNAGLQRCGKSCRLRWTNYLRPDIKRGRFSFEEEETIIQLHSILGNKWSAIAARLPGRTDNEIKNYWNTHIRKRLLRMGIDPVTHNPRLDLLDLSSILGSYNTHMNMSRFLQPVVNPEILRLASSIISSQRVENQNFVSHNGQRNQLSNYQPDLVQSNQFQEMPTCPTLTTATTTTTPFIPFSNETTHVMDPNVETYPSNISEEWQNDSGLVPNLTEDYISYNNSYYDTATTDQARIMDPSSETTTSTLISNDNNQNFNFASVLSAPSSSPTPLNSNSTYINGSSCITEDESYCSNMLNFEIPDFLDVSNFL